MANHFFTDKVIIITGASSGIGEELAYRLAAHGANLVLAAKRKELLGAVKTECDKRGGQTIIVPTDVTLAAQCEALIQKTVATFGKIDILVNNAGISMWSMFEEVTDLSIFEKIMQVNYLGSVYCTHYALPYLKASHGQIVGVSSLTGKNGVPTRSGYAASKHAMVGFFDTLRIELEEEDVAVTMIYPDFVATDIRKRAFRGDGQAVGKSPVREKEIMPVNKCVDLIMPAIQHRKRELVMSLRAKIGQYIKPFAPKLIDNVAKKAIKSGK